MTSEDVTVTSVRHAQEQAGVSQRQGVSNSTGVALSALASSYSVTMVGLRFPRSRSLIYCWENPERSDNSS